MRVNSAEENAIEEDRSTGIGCSEESRECLGVFSGGSSTARRQHSSTVDCAIHSSWKHCLQR